MTTTAAEEIRVRIHEATAVTPAIKRLKLVPIAGKALPEFSGGAHTVLSLESNERIIRNPYSLMDRPSIPRPTR